MTEAAENSITSQEREQLQRAVSAVLAGLDDAVLGQRAAAESLLIGYLAGGHVLVEGIPGVGKTVMARTFASLLGMSMKRIQFTPDLMPADVTGTNVFDAQSGGFRLVQGPIFTDLLMADEINRTPPKTQAALLEAMQEGQVTIDGVSHQLSLDFFVVATQNPIEFEGTYPLPEAQADRFLIRLEMGLPGAEAELALLRLGLKRELHRWRDRKLPEPVVTPDVARALRRCSRATHVTEGLLEYVLSLATEVRQSPVVDLGPSPRAVLALVEAARAAAWIDERDYLSPDDVQRTLQPCWGHRVLLTAEAELEGHSQASVLRDIAEKVAVPRA